MFNGATFREILLPSSSHHSTPYKLDCDSKGGGIMLYIRADIPSNLLAFEDKLIKSLFIELNLQNSKILIDCSYNPHKSEIKKHLAGLTNSLYLHSSKYKKILTLGYFNVETEEENTKLFCEDYNLKSLIKQPTCYKNSNKSVCIDLILTNVPRIFQSKCVIEARLSDFHLMAVAVMRKTLKKMHPRIINYRSYRDFCNETFRISPINNSSNEVFINNDDGLKNLAKPPWIL